MIADKKITIKTDFVDMKFSVQDLLRMMLKKMSVKDIVKHLCVVGIQDYMLKTEVFPSNMMASQSEIQNSEETLVLLYTNKNYDRLKEEAKKALKKVLAERQEK